MAKELAEKGTDAVHQSIDCADEAATRGFVEELAAKWGKIDNLVYCPGLTSPTSFMDIDYTSWKRHIAINLDGAYLVTHAALGHMIEASKGSIVLIGSAAMYTGGGGREPDGARCLRQLAGPSNTV